MKKLIYIIIGAIIIVVAVILFLQRSSEPTPIVNQPTVPKTQNNNLADIANSIDQDILRLTNGVNEFGDIEGQDALEGFDQDIADLPL